MNDIAYITDLHIKLNEWNIKIKKEDLNLITKKIPFRSKFSITISNLILKLFSHFDPDKHLEKMIGLYWFILTIFKHLMIILKIHFYVFNIEIRELLIWIYNI